MKTLRIGAMGMVAALGVFVAMPRLSGADQTISPGGVRVYRSASGLDLATPSEITVTINKASHKNVVVVEGTLSTTVIGEVGLTATVNSVAMEGGTSGSLGQECTGACTLSGTFFLDIDAAEAANPGTFFSGKKALPLEVGLEGESSVAATGSLILVARKEHK